MPGRTLTMQALEMTQAGMKPRHIAPLLGTTPKTVSALLGAARRKAGIPADPRRQAKGSEFAALMAARRATQGITPAQEQARELSRQGLSAYKAALVAGVSNAAMRNRYRLAGLPTSNRAYTRRTP